MNAGTGEEIKRVLLESDQHYKHLAEQHHILDDRLSHLTHQAYLSASEQLEETNLKKQKLALKDEMAQIAREFSSHQRFSP